MSAGEIRELLQQLQRGIGQPAVALECRCENLETVYVSLTPPGDVLVSDQGRTFAYLDRGTDSTYRPAEELDMPAAAEACRRSGARLRCDAPDALPRIECVLDSAGSVAEVVGWVAEAIDRVFRLALRDDLK
jgi:hypothetical protein